jgi:hypothetical protein
MGQYGEAVLVSRAAVLCSTYPNPGSVHGRTRQCNEEHE